MKSDVCGGIISKGRLLHTRAADSKTGHLWRSMLILLPSFRSNFFLGFLSKHPGFSRFINFLLYFPLRHASSLNRDWPKQENQSTSQSSSVSARVLKQMTNTFPPSPVLYLHHPQHDRFMGAASQPTYALRFIPSVTMECRGTRSRGGWQTEKNDDSLSPHSSSAFVVPLCSPIKCGNP